MGRPYRLGIFRRAFNTVTTLSLRLGIPFPGAYILTTVGRKTGTERSTPVLLIKDGGQRHLIAAYGVVGWVHNARAAGTVRISRGRRSTEMSIDELSPEQAAPILKKYVRKAPVVLPYFDAGRNSSLEAFAEETSRHPVFRLTPISA